MIITYNEEALRIKCEEVLPDEVGSLIDVLEKELANANRLGKNGIGLAAPQIGIAKKIAIIRLGNINLDLVNCHLHKGYDLTNFTDEGCLSFPGRVETTTRFQEVHIKNNLKGPNEFIATGFLAVACQHELDHVNSTLFMDRKIIVPDLSKKSKIGPNQPCICGSNKKYKKCCGR